MAKLALSVFLLVAAISLVACGRNRALISDINHVNTAPPPYIFQCIDGLVTMSVDVLGEAYVINSIHNNSIYELQVGLSFSLEAYINGAWVALPCTTFFPMEAFIIPPFGSYSMTKDLSQYLPLQPGRYRTRKSVLAKKPSFADEPIRGVNHEIVAVFDWPCADSR